MQILTNSNPQSKVVMLYQLQVWIKGLFPRVQLVASLIHQICVPVFPFDPPTQRSTYAGLIKVEA